MEELTVVQNSVGKAEIETADTEVQVEKKVKLSDGDPAAETKKKVLSKKSRGMRSKCELCRQILDDPDLRLYQGHPDESVEEFVALTDPKRCLFTGEEDAIDEHDHRPQNKVTYFSVYDKEGHLCPFDNGLIEQNFV
jgi:DNA (cytosine-5)-methyltransferase 1